MNDEKLKKYLSYVIIVLYVFFNIYLISNHEAWRDEAQAFTIARNLSVGNIFKILRVEGHPILWFLALKPFTLSGISFDYFSYYSLMIMTICAYVFLKKSPFPIWINIIVMCGLTFIYYNPIISRVYCLAALLVILVMACYKDRDSHPLLYAILISLLMQTHIKIYGLAFGLCVDYFLNYINKDRKKLIYLFIPLLSTILVFLELIPYGSYKPYKEVESYRFFYKIFETLFQEYLKVFRVLFGIVDTWSIVIITFLLCILLVIFVYKIIHKHLLKKYLGTIICAMCSFGCYFIISAFVYSSHTQMSTILSEIIIAIVWMIECKDDADIKKIARMFLVMCCVLNLKIEFEDIKNDIIYDYSLGKNTSLYIKDNLENDSVILLDYNSNNSPVYAYVVSYRKDIVFYDLCHKREYLFHQWSEQHEKLSYNEIFRIANDNFATKNVYLLSYELIYDERFELIYSNIDVFNLRNENYCIYKIIK